LVAAGVGLDFILFTFVGGIGGGSEDTCFFDAAAFGVVFVVGVVSVAFVAADGVVFAVGVAFVFEVALVFPPAAVIEPSKLPLPAAGFLAAGRADGRGRAGRAKPGGGPRLPFLGGARAPRAGGLARVAAVLFPSPGGGLGPPRAGARAPLAGARAPRAAPGCGGGGGRPGIVSLG